MAKLRTTWMPGLSVRDNILPNNIPYIPMLVEDIENYTRLADYKKCIKTIQTVGTVKPRPGRIATIHSIKSGSNAEILVSLRNLSIEDIYVKNLDDTYRTIWEQSEVFKIYGTLEEKDSRIILQATYILPIQDIDGTWKLMQVLSLLSHREVKNYYPTKHQNEIIKKMWNEMKEKKTRILNES